MWDIQRLSLVSDAAIQKRLPFAISTNEINNFIGNLSLAPEIIPTNNRMKYILHAVIKEALTQNKDKIEGDSYTIPLELGRVSANFTEQCMIVLDGLSLPDWCDIKDLEGNLIAKLVQIHAQAEKLKGQCTLDFGLNELQTINLAPQLLMRIPTPSTSSLKIKISLTTGSSTCDLDKWIQIPVSPLGLIIDTRDSDILLRCTPTIAKKLTIEWLQSLDIPTSDI